MRDDCQTYIDQLGMDARAAARTLAMAGEAGKNAALRASADALRAATDQLIAANVEDMELGRQSGRAASFLDRLELNKARIGAMADALDDIAALPDPVGRLLARIECPNGLVIERVAVPIGVIAMVYESRPNVGADAGALCLKSGNAVILRGGSDSLNSTRVIVECLHQGLDVAGLPRACIQMVDTADRRAVTHLLQCTQYVDLAIPRGGRGLVELVRDQARVPTLLHLDGNCHTYVHAAADLEKALAIIVNAKMRRTGICGATESLIVDRQIAPQLLPMLADAMPGCELRGDAEAMKIAPSIVAANEDDWGREYLDAILSIRLVDGAADAIAHVQRYSSNHTDAIITEDHDVAERFLASIDSAIVMHNASTQFADGGEFGMGAEIGIATGKLHARGPVGLEQLTSFQYRVRGNGQTRP